VRTTFENNKK